MQLSAKQPAGRNSQKNTEKLGAIPNQRIKKRENAFVVVQTPLILSLTPNTHTPTPPFPLILSIILKFSHFGEKTAKSAKKSDLLV